MISPQSVLNTHLFLSAPSLFRLPVQMLLHTRYRTIPADRQTARMPDPVIAGQGPRSTPCYHRRTADNKCRCHPGSKIDRPQLQRLRYQAKNCIWCPPQHCPGAPQPPCFHADLQQLASTRAFNCSTPSRPGFRISQRTRENHDCHDEKIAITKRLFPDFISTPPFIEFCTVTN